MMNFSLRYSLVCAALTLCVDSQAATTDTLKKIRESGSVSVGVRESSGAMSFTLGDGKYAGFHYDVCMKVIADIQKQLGLKSLDLKFQPVTPQNRIPLVVNGTVDIECGTTTNNAARQKIVSFAPTLYVEEVRIAVKSSSSVANISQLANKTVAATVGSTAVQLVRKHERASGTDFKELYGKDNADGFLLLESGRADAYVADGQILATLIAQSKQPEAFKLLPEVLSVEPIAIMIPKDDPDFKKAVDNTIVAMTKSGEIAALYDKWFMKPIPPNNRRIGLPVSAATKAAWATPSDKPLEDYLSR